MRLLVVGLVALLNAGCFELLRCEAPSDCPGGWTCGEAGTCVQVTEAAAAAASSGAVTSSGSAVTSSSGGTGTTGSGTGTSASTSASTSTGLTSSAMASSSSSSGSAPETGWVEATALPATVRALVVSPTTSTTVYAGLDSGGVYRSDDGGESWTAFSTGLPDGATTLALAAASKERTSGTTLERLLVATSQGIFWRNVDDSGWDSGGPTNPNGTDMVVALDPQNPEGRAYAAHSTGAIRRSLDGGDAWTLLSDNFPAGPPDEIRAVAIGLSNRVYVAGVGPEMGIFLTTNDGNSWQNFPAGLNNIQALALDTTTVDQHVYVINRTEAETRLYRMSAIGGDVTELGGVVNPNRLAIGRAAGGYLRVYVAGKEEGAVVTWNVVASTIDPPAAPAWERGVVADQNVSSESVRALAGSPTAPLTAYAALVGGGRFFRTSTGGR